MAKILIIDDEETICSLLHLAISRMGHEPEYVHSIKDGREKALRESFNVILLDVNLPDGNGLSLLPELRKHPPHPEVIIMTGEGDPDGAELAIKNGAWDYIEKPLSVQNMILPLTRALQYSEEKKAASSSLVLKREGIVGECAKIRHCLDQVAQAALSNTNILITGEAGTGKELFASSIHNNSNRCDQNFVIVDCAAIPESLFESTLFGHVGGVSTGGYSAGEGLIKQADRGTLFLDEIGELPMSVQKTFLRVLHEKKFRPVGGRNESRSDFRLVAASSRDLDRLIRENKFNRDLLSSIRSLTISLPPLRERVQDIKELAIHVISKVCERERIGTKGFSPDFIKTLEAYNWPGNIRELINLLEESIIRARYEPTLFPKDLPEQIRINPACSAVSGHAQKTAGNDNRAVNTDVLRSIPTIKEFRENIIYENEKNYLKKLLTVTGGNIKEACRIAGLGRARMYGLMKNYGISRGY